MPIVFATARDHEDDLVTALKAGADDYLVKPLRRMELLARLEALARRGHQPQSEHAVFEVGLFRVDRQRRNITWGSESLDLTSKDFDLAVLLLRNIGRLLSRHCLLHTIWGEKATLSSRTLDTYISRVRTRLKLTPEYGWRLRALYGYGYRLEPHTKPTSGSEEGEPEAS